MIMGHPVLDGRRRDGVMLGGSGLALPAHAEGGWKVDGAVVGGRRVTGIACLACGSVVVDPDAAGFGEPLRLAAVGQGSGES